MSPKKEYSFIFSLNHGIVSSGETEKRLLGRFESKSWSDETREALREFMETARAGYMFHAVDEGGYTNIVVCNYAGETTHD